MTKNENPQGKFQVIIESAKHIPQLNRFVWNFLVLDPGPDNGKKIVKWSNLNTENAREYFRQDIQKCGVSPSDWERVLSGEINLSGIERTVTSTVNSQGFPAAYIDGPQTEGNPQKASASTHATEPQQSAIDCTLPDKLKQIEALIAEVKRMVA